MGFALRLVHIRLSRTVFVIRREGDLLPDDKKTPVPRIREVRGATRTDRWGVASQVLLVVAILVWTATLAYEVRLDAAAVAAKNTVAAPEPGSDDILLLADQDEPAEPSANTTLLPASVDGWLVQGVQGIPGADAGGVEAHLVPSPQDEQRSLAMPLSVYVRVDSLNHKGPDHVERQLADRYTQDRGHRDIGGQSVSVGRTPDRGSYYVAWVRDDTVYEVDATFRYRIPASGGDSVIEGAALEIAAAVIAHRPGQGGAK